MRKSAFRFLKNTFSLASDRENRYAAIRLHTGLLMGEQKMKKSFWRKLIERAVIL